MYVKEQFMNTQLGKKQPDELTNKENTKPNIMPDYSHKILTIIVNIARLPWWLNQIKVLYLHVYIAQYKM